MAGPAKKRAQAEKTTSSSSDTQQSSREDAGRTQRSTPKSIPRLDGNKDPAVSHADPNRAPIDYSRANDLKNISDFLGMAGWYVARGVRPNFFLSPLPHRSSSSWIMHAGTRHAQRIEPYPPPTLVSHLCVLYLLCLRSRGLMGT